VFGAGGGTSSYEETRNTDLIVLWGSNAREAHPIFFHHVLKAVHKGAKLIVVDPRRTASAQWADLWLGIDVGTDIPLANAVGREIIASGLVNLEFVERATTGFDAYRESIEPWHQDVADDEIGPSLANERERPRSVVRSRVRPGRATPPRRRRRPGLPGCGVRRSRAAGSRRPSRTNRCVCPRARARRRAAQLAPG